MRILAPFRRLFRYLSPSQVSDSVASQSSAAIHKEILLQFILNLLLGVFLAGLPATYGLLADPAWALPLGFYYSGVFLLAVLTLDRRLHYHLRAGVLTAFFYSAGLVLLVRGGLGSVGAPILLFSILLAGFLFEFTAGMVVFTISALAFAVVGRSMVRGEIPLPPLTEILSSSSRAAWTLSGAIFIVSGFLIVVSGWLRNRGMARSLDAQRQLTRLVEDEKYALESRIQANAEEARQRLARFEVASQIARDISAETRLEPLLQNTVNRICEQFGFYYAAVFMMDGDNEYAELRAASGEAGQQLVQRKHRLKVGETSFVGFVMARGEPRISADVEEDTVHYKNPLLPETQSEMALPLLLGGRVIGALDVQSVDENAFTQEDVRILQTVADQLAVAVANTRLVERMQKNVEELEASQRQSTREVWKTHLRNARRTFAYRYADARLVPEAPETPQAQEAVQLGLPVLKKAGGQADGSSLPVTALAVPIKLRGQVLGVVDIAFESASVSPDLQELIESTVNRLAISLENARLMEEIRYRAERERLVSDITSKVRATAEVDHILKITAQELGRSLGVSEVMVQLRPSDR